MKYRAKTLDGKLLVSDSIWRDDDQIFLAGAHGEGVAVWHEIDPDTLGIVLSDGDIVDAFELEMSHELPLIKKSKPLNYICMKLNITLSHGICNRHKQKELNK